ncbi:MAG: hypothetical protein ACI4PC_09920 [Oscillospiraceae bacterium]
MTKTLFKKQMMEVFSWLYQNRKTGKNRSARGIVLYALLYLLIFGFLGVFFYGIAGTLCAPLVSVGLGWLFFALMGLIAVVLGVFGSVFNTYSSLYRAKDNDLLLSMPIPSSRVLLIRLSGVYAIGLLYELIVMIPTLIVFFMDGTPSALGVVFSLLIPLVLSLFVLTLSCVLGWVVALVAGRLKNKNIVTVILSLAFLAAYYYVYMRAYSLLQSILANPDGVSSTVRSVLYPFYHMGLAAEGHPVSMLIFTGILAALFALVYLLLQRSFLRLATANRGAVRTKYREKAARAGSIGGALLRKELRRFLGSPTYMLNCGLGIVFMLIAAAALLIKQAAVADFVQAVFVGYEDAIPLLACAALGMLASMNDITAPSVSLEGKSLWLVQSFPVSGWQALKAKITLHLLLTFVPLLLLTVCLEVVLRPAPVFALLIPVVTLLFALLMALLGLSLGLKMPNLNWTNEAVPVKQSMAVTLALFGGWVLVLALGGLYVLLSRFLSPLVYLLGVAVLLAAGSAALLFWLRGRGGRIFETL